jgi:hypothetical protein
MGIPYLSQTSPSWPEKQKRKGTENRQKPTNSRIKINYWFLYPFYAKLLKQTLLSSFAILSPITESFSESEHDMYLLPTV